MKDAQEVRVGLILELSHIVLQSQYRSRLRPLKAGTTTSSFLLDNLYDVPPQPSSNSNYLASITVITFSSSPFLIPAKRASPCYNRTPLKMPSATGQNWEKYTKKYADEEEPEKKITPLTDEDIQVLKTYGAAPYAAGLKRLEKQIKEKQASVNEKTGRVTHFPNYCFHANIS